MEDHLQAAVDKGDTAALAKGLKQAARLAPDPSWNGGERGWNVIADSGAAAATAGDLAEVKRACKTCHKDFRAKYKELHRKRPIPD